MGDPHVLQRGNPQDRGRAWACHGEALRGEAREVHLRDDEVVAGGCHGEDHKRKEDSEEGEDDLQGRGKDGHGEGEEVGEVHDGEVRGEEDEGQGECHFHGEDREEDHGEVVGEDAQRRDRRTYEQCVGHHP